MRVVADTHAVVWYLARPDRLSAAAVEAMDAAVDAGDTVAVSAISLVEIQYLVEKKRLSPVLLRRLDEALAERDPAFEIVALDVGVAVALREVPRDEVPDMPDRIIVATALHLDAPLVSCDGRIRSAFPRTIW